MQRTATILRAIRPAFVSSRAFSVQTAARSSWTPGPAPPRLPKEEQEIFEKLQQQSTGAFSTPRAPEPEAKDEANAAADELLDASQPETIEPQCLFVRAAAHPLEQAASISEDAVYRQSGDAFVLCGERVVWRCPDRESRWPS